ncbi:MAG: hypothetical protein A2Y17_05595 [Clostridiales bacterium GWF2_38_85]|nr:MAG: hypothetical protein A2Y17_05595 [Clostridiales bacterium GWF2_38_85]HBL84045.1 hypothetical protein [Clostridiales bacterium]
MKKILLVITISILLLFTSCVTDNSNSRNSDVDSSNVSILSSEGNESNDIQDESTDISDESNDTSNESNDTSSESNNISFAIDMDQIFGSVDEVYSIDVEYINEVNNSGWLSTAAKGNITYEYTQKWKDKMQYYYEILYTALSDDRKTALKTSQENWQSAFESELKLNSEILAQNLINYDIYEYFDYLTYRSRAISLYKMCCSMNNLYDIETGTWLYDDLE